MRLTPIFKLMATLAVTHLLVGTLQAAPRELDRIVAIVDDDIIMESELAERTAEIATRMKSQQGQLPPKDALNEQVLERMIVENIELQMADRAGIRIDDNQLNETLANIARQNNMTTDQFRETILQEGMSWASLRDQIRRELTINQMRQRRVGARIQISDKDVDAFLNSELAKTNLAPDYRLGHILIPTKQDTDVAAAEETALMVYKKLKEGADFSSMALQYSAGETALSGGDLGWRKAAQLPTIFADVALEMKAGEVSAPIRSASGFHIIKVLELRGGTEQMVEQTKTRHILVKPNEIRSESETQHLINEIHDDVVADPEQFPILAKTYSDDPGSAMQGGELGWVNPGTMVPEFEKVMSETQPGGISEPFQSNFGWHILQVEERRRQDMSEEFRRNRARQMLQRRRFDEELDGWLREIRQNAYVEIKL
ncbi:peptidylprolyl isomerase [Ketobacter nezhaii]|uniref:peptidylprolyl isomerase n=1 Tax=Ketobacter sp. MCCC 1A13808 TaxID=2602738 RepID=UPI001E54052E|nr:peptidylprolyl isomerase [Ketobacter sp. MCCC 1A13808]